MNLTDLSLVKDILLGIFTVGSVIYTNSRNRKKLEDQQKVANAQAEERHKAWMEKTDKRLEEAEDRLEEHADRFDDFVSRTDLERSLDSIRALVHSTDTWLRTMLPILLGRVMPGGFMPVPEAATKIVVEETKG
jgi:hypothetical protein